LSSILRKIIYHIGYIFFYKLDYANLIKEYHFIKKNIYRSVEHNKQIQRERLYDIIKYAISNIPYYANIAKERKIKIKKETIFEDLKKFPLLTKDLIRKNWNSLVRDPSKFKYRTNTSGGTTGEPLKLYQDSNYYVKGEAVTLVFDEIAGYSVGDRLIRLWGSQQDILIMTKSTLKKLKNKYIKNTLFLNTYRMTKEDVLNYINKINKFRPKIIIAYIHSLLELIKQAEYLKIPFKPVKAIISSTGVLTKEAKKKIQDTFKCKVFNRYGSREIGMIATSCEREDTLHINMYQQFVEILDDKGNDLAENERGEIVITNFTNRIMPLIRYKIGDIGAFNYAKCSCGRGLHRLENIYGRTLEIFKTKKGTLIDGYYFVNLLFFMENLKQFQIVQNNLDELEVYLTTLDGNPLDKSIERDLTDKMQFVMGKECEIKFIYLPVIEPSPSGKLRYTISNL